MLAIGALVLVVAASVAGPRIYWQWQLGRIELYTDFEPVVVQVLADASDTAIGEPFDVATRAVVELPAGEYRLRVKGAGPDGAHFSGRGQSG